MLYVQQEIYVNYKSLNFKELVAPYKTLGENVV